VPIPLPLPLSPEDIAFVASFGVYILPDDANLSAVFGNEISLLGPTAFFDRDVCIDLSGDLRVAVAAVPTIPGVFAHDFY
jgi:hypothetical protein